MQVFITSQSFTESAQVLDSRRANKQIIECNQVYLAAIGASKGWSNHCITRLWKSDLSALMAFAWACYYKRINEGGNPVKPVADPDSVSIKVQFDELSIKLPHFVKLSWWINSMRSHLLAKDYEYYSKFNWNVEPISGYYALDKYNNWLKYSVK